MEVLVALVVSGICLAVVFQAFSQALRLRTKAESVEDAAHLLKELLSEESFVEDVLRRRGGTGPVPGAEGWVFEASVAPVEYVAQGVKEERQMADMAALTLCVARERTGGGKHCVTGWYPVVP